MPRPSLRPASTAAALLPCELPVQRVRLCGRALVVHDRPDGPNHGDGVVGLPYVAAHVDADGPGGERVRRQLERLALARLLAACDNDGDGARLDDPLEALAVVCLYDPGALLGGHPARERQVPCIAGHVLADGRDGEHGDAVLLCLVDEPAEVHYGLPLVPCPDEHGHCKGARPEPEGVLDAYRDLLVREVFANDGRPAGHAQHDGHARVGVYARAQHAAREHERVAVLHERPHRPGRVLEPLGRPQKVAVVDGEHDGPPARLPHDVCHAPLEAPVHGRAPLPAR